MMLNPMQTFLQAKLHYTMDNESQKSFYCKYHTDKSFEYSPFIPISVYSAIQLPA